MKKRLGLAHFFKKALGEWVRALVDKIFMFRMFR